MADLSPEQQQLLNHWLKDFARLNDKIYKAGTFATKSDMASLMKSFFWANCSYANCRAAGFDPYDHLATLCETLRFDELIYRIAKVDPESPTTEQP